MTLTRTSGVLAETSRETANPDGSEARQWAVRPRHHVAIFLFAFLLISLRRPDALLNAQFWAEDGHVWYADAYNLGWFHALFRTFGGYFQLQPRFAAALAILAPLSRAPLILNLIAIAGCALPVNILLSSRCANWGSLRFRALLAAAYLALPASPDVRAIITNGHWVLALCTFLIIVGVPPTNTSQRICDFALLLLSGLSGPFCFFLFPVAAFMAWNRHDPWRWLPVWILAACSCLQAWALLFLGRGARSTTLGASPDLFVRILAGNVYLGSVLGPNPLARLRGPIGLSFLLLVGVAASIFGAVVLKRARIELKLLCFLAGAILVASLVSPLMYVPPGASCWEILQGASNTRYWFLPTLAIVWLLLDTAWHGTGPLRKISAILLVYLPIAMAVNWRDPAFRDLHFAGQAKRFEAAPAGATINIPLNPEGWTLSLTKHANSGH